jgi:hypothetical protein
MGKAMAVYVKERDEKLWQRAKDFAEARRLNMSALVMMALERFLDEEEPIKRKARSARAKPRTPLVPPPPRSQ